MNLHASRLGKLEASLRVGRYARITDAELKARLDVLCAKAGVEDTDEARTAFLTTLRKDLREEAHR